MRLAKDDILQVAHTSYAGAKAYGEEVYFYRNSRQKDESLTFGEGGEDSYNKLKMAFNDLIMTAAIAQEAETICMDALVVVDIFTASVDAKQRGVDLPFMLPFDNIVFQFGCIPECSLFEYEGLPFSRDVIEGDIKALEVLKNDKVEAVVIGKVPNEDNRYLVSAWFSSFAVNVAIMNDLGQVIWMEGADGIESASEEKKENKRRLSVLGYGLVGFVNSMNVSLRHNVPTRRVQNKRRKKGKRPLPVYWQTIIKERSSSSRYVDSAGGGWHNRLHMVRGHWRQLRNGRVVWVHPHMRGFHEDQDEKGERTHYEYRT